MNHGTTRHPLPSLVGHVRTNGRHYIDATAACARVLARHTGWPMVLSPGTAYQCMIPSCHGAGLYASSSLMLTEWPNVRLRRSLRG